MLSLRSLVGAAVAAAAVALAAPPSLAASFYEGKTVTLIVPNTAGGAMTQYARMLAPHIAKNLGAKEMRVDNQPGAGSLRGTNMVWNAKPDGLTVAFTGIPTLVLAQLAGSPGVNFDTAKFTYLGSVADDPRVLVVNPKLKSVQELQQLNRPFMYPTQGTDEDFYTMAVLFQALGQPPLKAVTGYQGLPDTTLAVIKGDGDGLMTSWAGVVPSIKSGETRPILHMGEKRSQDFPDVPAYTEIITDQGKIRPLKTMVDILATTRGFFGPPNMEAQAVSEMRAAIAKTLADPAVVEESKKRGLPLSYYSGESEQARMQRILEGGKDLTPILKAASESIK
jgi:tripartite-type tricarboxylate transporter receptor subunit TctC